MRFEPNRDLDHSVSEDIVKSIIVTSSDFDNEILWLQPLRWPLPMLIFQPSMQCQALRSETNLVDGSAPSAGAVSSTQTITFTQPKSDDVVRSV